MVNGYFLVKMDYLISSYGGLFFGKSDDTGKFSGKDLRDFIEFKHEIKWEDVDSHMEYPCYLKIDERKVDCLLQKSFSNSFSTDYLFSFCTIEDSLELDKENFIANVSHELRTPLNAINGLIKIVLETELTDNQKEVLNTAESASNHLMHIINDILDYSKIKMGKLTFETISFNLIEICDELKRTFQQKVDDKNITLSVKIDKQIPEFVVGDFFRLKQILYNLVDNAIKFTETGSVKVELNATELKAKSIGIKFDVIDTGIGIKKGDIEEVFSDFSQAERGTSRKFGGTGLGLPICKKMINLQDGTISVESDYGSGSRFSFELPFGLTAQKKKKQEKKEIFSINDIFNVLIFEDDRINQLLMSKVFSTRIPNATIRIANNGNEGLEMLKSFSPNLILMDLRMPEKDGYQATEEIRKNKEMDHIPIICMSANALEMDVNRAMDLGMNDYITKPFDINNFIEKVGKLLNYNFKKDEELKDNRSGEKTNALNLITISSIIDNEKKSNFAQEIYLRIMPKYIFSATRSFNKKDYEQLNIDLSRLKRPFFFIGKEDIIAEIEESKFSLKNDIDIDLLSEKMELIRSEGQEVIKLMREYFSGGNDKPIGSKHFQKVS